MADAKRTTKQKRIQKSDNGVVVTLPPMKAPHWLQGFVNFVREQGVVALAVGLILGIAAKSVVDSLVGNIFNPIVGLLYGGGDLSAKYICLKQEMQDGAMTCTSKLGYGSFLNSLISFMIMAAAVYFLVKALKLDKLDKKKES